MLVIGSSARTREGRNLLVPLAFHAIDYYLTGARFLSKEEDIVGPYKFGVYDVLVLPPSFPYGGMVSRLISSPNRSVDGPEKENACLSFLTPSQCSFRVSCEVLTRVLQLFSRETGV